jgi:hypothetical protein
LIIQKFLMISFSLKKFQSKSYCCWLCLFLLYVYFSLSLLIFLMKGTASNKLIIYHHKALAHSLMETKVTSVTKLFDSIGQISAQTKFPYHWNRHWGEKWRPLIDQAKYSRADWHQGTWTHTLYCWNSCRHDHSYLFQPIYQNLMGFIHG